MKNLILNPKTRLTLESYLKDPTQTLLLYGQKGVGLSTIAAALACSVAGPSVALIAPQIHKSQKTRNINVDDIEGIHDIAHNKRTDPLAVIIDEADKLTGPAPQALLKLLEEPGENIHFILTTSNLHNLPATILSRAQTIQVLPCAKEDYRTALSSIKPESKQKQIEFMAAGLPAEIRRLSEDDEYFRRRARLFEQAKAYVNSTTYDRLKIIPEFKTRDDARDFVSALAKLVGILAAKSDKSSELDVLSKVLDNLSHNGNTKAQMTYLALNF